LKPMILVLLVTRPFDEDHGMATGGRSAVTEEISGPHLFEVGDGAAKAVGSNAALLRVTVAFDIPKLQQVEEVAKSHAVEIVRVEALWRLRSFIARTNASKVKPQQ